MSPINNPALPSLDELVETSDYKAGPGIGLNEIIVAAGYHPAEYGRYNADRALGGSFPRYGSEEWKDFIAPHIAARAHKSVN